MRRPLVLGNWKMNGTKASNAELIEGLKAAAVGVDSVTIGVCPPAVFIAQIQELAGDSNICIGAQDVSVQSSGAYTGEWSADMLTEFGVSYVLVGHSERRTYHNESDELIAKKFKATQDAGLVPVLCIGETLEEREAGKLESVITTQVNAVIDAYGIEAYKNAVIAYEPVWAIGTGVTATSEQAQEAHALIRKLLAEKDAEVAAGIQILYGGSMKPGNAAELMAMEDIDGGLVGGASLVAADFAGIFNAAK
ncbi:triose-phosphate isomerase [Corallincola platygyrae]|uniref:Triosephosphate isomerase n=1 Tax=Corallincola platygyrae TaxID=1193278 RepID=A0ABW4XMZ0_9GAMM